MIIQALEELEKEVMANDYDNDSKEMIKRWKIAISKESDLLSIQQLDGFKILIEKLRKDIENMNQRLLNEYELSEIDRKVIIKLRAEKELFLKMFSGINQRLSDYTKQINEYYVQIQK